MSAYCRSAVRSQPARRTRFISFTGQVATVSVARRSAASCSSVPSGLTAAVALSVLASAVAIAVCWAVEVAESVPSSRRAAPAIVHTAGDGSGSAGCRGSSSRSSRRERCRDLECSGTWARAARDSAAARRSAPVRFVRVVAVVARRRGVGGRPRRRSGRRLCTRRVASSSAAATAGWCASAAPMPRATATAPIRPTADGDRFSLLAKAAILPCCPYGNAARLRSGGDRRNWPVSPRCCRGRRQTPPAGHRRW